MAFLPFLLLHEFLRFTDGYSEEEMPEIVAIMEPVVLPAPGTVEEAGEDTLGDVVLIGDAQILALEPGARQPCDPRRIAGLQFPSSSLIAFLDPADQIGHRSRRGHGEM